MDLLGIADALVSGLYVQLKTEGDMRFKSCKHLKLKLNMCSNKLTIWVITFNFGSYFIHVETNCSIFE